VNPTTREMTRELLAEVTRRLVEELDPDQVILFGSRAWGTPDPDSDVDLLLVLPGDVVDPGTAEFRARRCLRGLGLSKDILVRSRAQLDRMKAVRASLEAKIVAEGQILYQPNRQ
jgi:predicted nucleotidyltransferase